MSRPAVSEFFVPIVQVRSELCSFVLRPFASPGFRRASSLLRPRLTSQDLSAPGSAWFSAVPVPSRRRALRRSVSDRRASPFPAGSPPGPPPRCPFVFLRSRVCLPPFQRVPHGSLLAVRLRLSSCPVGDFSPRKVRHLPGTLGGQHRLAAAPRTDCPTSRATVLPAHKRSRFTDNLEMYVPRGGATDFALKSRGLSPTCAAFPVRREAMRASQKCFHEAHTSL